MTNSANEARFAIQEVDCIDPEVKGTLYWNFTAWAYSADRLLTREHAEAELARLQLALPHAVHRMSIVDIVAMKARAAVYGPAFRASLVAARGDTPREQFIRTPEILATARRMGDEALKLAGFDVEVAA